MGNAIYFLFLSKIIPIFQLQGWEVCNTYYWLSQCPPIKPGWLFDKLGADSDILGVILE